MILLGDDVRPSVPTVIGGGEVIVLLGDLPMILPSYNSIFVDYYMG
jgi:hypothetical protein